jgi:hypothetical protein
LPDHSERLAVPIRREACETRCKFGPIADLIIEETTMIRGMHAMFYSSRAHKLKSRGVEFSQNAEDHGFGFVTFFNVPGGFKVQLYQPTYRK